MEQSVRVGLGPIDRLVFLAAWLVSCAAVYALGFYTGTHSRDRVAGDEDRIVVLPVEAQPPPAGKRSKTDEDLTFWNALESGGPRTKPGDGIPAREVTAPPVEPAPPRAPSVAAGAGAGGRARKVAAKPAQRKSAAPARTRKAKPAAGKVSGPTKAKTASAPARVNAPSGAKRPGRAQSAKAAIRPAPAAAAAGPPAAPATASRRTEPAPAARKARVAGD